jgi:hypothetical protein
LTLFVVQQFGGKRTDGMMRIIPWSSSSLVHLASVCIIKM